MSLAVEINVALREQNCQKIGSERVKEVGKKGLTTSFIGHCIQGKFRPVIFSPFSLSDLRANLKLGQLNSILRNM